jgi:hypothetical protein
MEQASSLSGRSPLIRIRFSRPKLLSYKHGSIDEFGLTIREAAAEGDPLPLNERHTAKVQGQPPALDKNLFA